MNKIQKKGKIYGVNNEPLSVGEQQRILGISGEIEVDEASQVTVKISFTSDSRSYLG